MKSIAFSCMKGGTGKTQISIQIAATLAKECNKKVLYIDTDAQCNSSNYLGINEFEEGYKSLYDILKDNIKPEEAVRKTYIDFLDIIGGSLNLVKLDKALVSAGAREFRLKNYISRNQDFFNRYNLIIFDTNPSMNTINEAVFTACDSILIVTEPSTAGVKGAELFIELWSEIAKELNIDTKIHGIIANRCVKNTKILQAFEDTINMRQYKDYVFDARITESTAFKNAEAQRNVLLTFGRRNKQHKEIMNLVKEMQEKGILDE